VSNSLRGSIRFGYSESIIPVFGAQKKDCHFGTTSLGAGWVEAMIADENPNS